MTVTTKKSKKTLDEKLAETAESFFKLIDTNFHAYPIPQQWTTMSSDKICVVASPYDLEEGRKFASSVQTYFAEKGIEVVLYIYPENSIAPVKMPNFFDMLLKSVDAQPARLVLIISNSAHCLGNQVGYLELKNGYLYHTDTPTLTGDQASFDTLANLSFGYTARYIRYCLQIKDRTLLKTLDNKVAPNYWSYRLDSAIWNDKQNA